MVIKEDKEREVSEQGSKPKPGMFTCPFCGRVVDIGEMRILKQYKPPVVVCKECWEKT
jgi:transcription elongation factor Elf1